MPIEEDVDPHQPLPPAWLKLLDDGSPEFRLAAAANGLRPIGYDATDSPVVQPFRAHLEPIEYRWDQTASTSANTSVSWKPNATGQVLWDKEPDVDGLSAIVAERLKKWQSAPQRILRGSIAAPLGYVESFVADDTDEAKLSRLCFSLSVLDVWRLSEDPLGRPPELRAAPDPVLALMYLSFSGRPLGEQGLTLPLNRDIFLLAKRGDVESTVEFARAHLRKHGYRVGRDTFETNLGVERMAPVTSFPLAESDRTMLARRIRLTTA